MFLKPKIKRLLTIVKKAPFLELLFIEIVFGLVWNIIALGSFAYLTKHVLTKEFINYDYLISVFIYSFRTSHLTSLMKLFTTLGGTPVVFVLSVLIILLLIKKHKKEAFLFALSLILGCVLNYLFKIIFHQPRPEIAPLIKLKDYTYPSGHAMNNLVFYCLLAFYTFHFTENKKLSVLAGIIAFFMVAVIGFSRIYLGVHYPSDVLAGWLVGFWLLITILIIDKTLTLHRGIKSFRESEN